MGEPLAVFVVGNLSPRVALAEDRPGVRSLVAVGAPWTAAAAPEEQAQEQEEDEEPEERHQRPQPEPTVAVPVRTRSQHGEQRHFYTSLRIAESRSILIVSIHMVCAPIGLLRSGLMRPDGPPLGLLLATTSKAV